MNLTGKNGIRLNYANTKGQVGSSFSCVIANMALLLSIGDHRDLDKLLGF